MTPHRLPDRDAGREPGRLADSAPDPGRAWVKISFVLLALAGLSLNAAGAPPAVEVQSVRVGFGGGNAYKLGCWTPVRVQLKAGAERFSGVLVLSTPDDDGVPSSFTLPIDLPAGESTRVTAYARPGGPDAEFDIQILDPQGRRVVNAPQAITLPNGPASLMPDEFVILTLGQPMGIDQVPNLPGFAAGGNGPAALTSSRTGVVVERIEHQSDQLPGRWYGFDAAGAVIVDTDDRESLQALEGARGQALVEWVRRGGHLVVAVGENGQAVRDSVLAPILPALPAGQERVPSLEVIDTFAVSTKPLTPPGTPPVMVSRLEGADQRGGKILSITGNLPLIVRGAPGFGRVTLIGLSVNQKLFADWPDRGLFWARALDLRHDRADASGGGGLGGSGRFYRSGVTDLSSQLRIGLEQFPGVKLIPFGWVAFFIFLYIMLIGPGDYFFLKKVLKRMELTWITFPTIVVTVSLLAYFVAFRLKGNDLLVNKVDVIDVDQVSGVARGRSIASLFSPQNRDYGIGFLPVSPAQEGDIAPGRADESGEAPRPPAGTELVTSWFSVPEQQFGGMSGNNRRFSFLGSGYAYEPTGGLERLDHVRVPIWSTRAFTARWFGPSGPLVESDLRPIGTDRLAGTVVNRLPYPLEDAILAFGKQVYLLKTIAPGATVKVELSSDRNLAGELRERGPSYYNEQPGARNQKINRANLLMAMMFHESESNRTTEQGLGNAPLHELDLSGQLALDRPMLVARVDRPGAQLVLRNAPSAPKIEQTTMLRVILPLNRKREDRRAAAPDATPPVTRALRTAGR